MREDIRRLDGKAVTVRVVEPLEDPDGMPIGVEIIEFTGTFIISSALLPSDDDEDNNSGQQQ